MYISLLLKIHKNLKNLRKKNLILPMFLQEGGRDHCHLESLNQHMETSLVLEISTPVTSRNHCHTHSELIHRRPVIGKSLPI